MDGILLFVDHYINHIIIVLGFGVLAALVICGVVLSNLKHSLEEQALGRGGVRTLVNPETLTATQEHFATVSREDTAFQRKNFNKWCSVYFVCAQLITVLPLLGILGTVAGLILNVRAEDLDAVFSSLNTALSSTLIALFFAIILKVVDSFSTSRIIFQIETLFEEFDRRFRDAIDMGHFHE
ncbi:MAG: MotA/TolQ/ExbB proton channel family protein [Lachnospiraceae bacterium]|nr:MotA/TolQ/ExbB proton channel family protein [Lachnospiraceae bacterium]